MIKTSYVKFLQDSVYEKSFESDNFEWVIEEYMVDICFGGQCRFVWLDRYCWSDHKLVVNYTLDLKLIQFILLIIADGCFVGSLQVCPWKCHILSPGRLKLVSIVACSICTVFYALTCSFQPVNCNIISRMQSLQAIIMNLASWTLVYYLSHCLDHPTSALVKKRQASVMQICSTGHWSVRKWFGAHHVQWGRLKPGCWIVGSVTSDWLTTLADSPRIIPCLILVRWCHACPQRTSVHEEAEVGG